MGQQDLLMFMHSAHPCLPIRLVRKTSTSRRNFTSTGAVCERVLFNNDASVVPCVMAETFAFLFVLADMAAVGLPWIEES